MTGTIRIEEFKGSRGPIFWVWFAHPSGNDRKLAERETRLQAVLCARDYSQRYGIAMHSAEVVQMRRVAA